MEAREFSRYTPYTFAQDVDINLVTRIKEQSRNFPGVFIEVEPIREYETEYAAHLLGRVGLIYKEEYADLKKKATAWTIWWARTAWKKPSRNICGR